MVCQWNNPDAACAAGQLRGRRNHHRRLHRHRLELKSADCLERIRSVHIRGHHSQLAIHRLPIIAIQKTERAGVLRTPALSFVSFNLYAGVPQSIAERLAFKTWEIYPIQNQWVPHTCASFAHEWESTNHAQLSFSGPEGIHLYAALASLAYSTNSVGRLSTTLKFISARDEHAGHSRLASLTQLQSRQSTA